MYQSRNVPVKSFRHLSMILNSTNRFFSVVFFLTLISTLATAQRAIPDHGGWAGHGLAQRPIRDRTMPVGIPRIAGLNLDQGAAAIVLRRPTRRKPTRETDDQRPCSLTGHALLTEVEPARHGTIPPRIE